MSGGLGWMPGSWALAISAALLIPMMWLQGHQRTRSAAEAMREVSLVLALYAAWNYAGALSLTGLHDASAAGRRLAGLEQSLGWPTEAQLQRPVLDLEWITRAADTYYAALHVPVFVITLAWVLLLHRRDWPFVRTTAALLTGACMLVQYWPVAPPRLVPELGVVDTAAGHGLSVYAAIPGANEYSAMPSVHMAWSAAVALFVVVVARSRWRWVVIAYPVATLWVIVVTGNHYIIDGVVSVLLLPAAAGAALVLHPGGAQRLRLNRGRQGATAAQATPSPQEPGTPVLG